MRTFHCNSQSVLQSVYQTVSNRFMQLHLNKWIETKYWPVGPTFHFFLLLVLYQIVWDECQNLPPHYLLYPVTVKKKFMRTTFHRITCNIYRPDTEQNVGLQCFNQYWVGSFLRHLYRENRVNAGGNRRKERNLLIHPKNHASQIQ